MSWSSSVLLLAQNCASGGVSAEASSSVKLAVGQSRRGGSEARRKHKHKHRGTRTAVAKKTKNEKTDAAKQGAVPGSVDERPVGPGRQGRVAPLECRLASGNAKANAERPTQASDSDRQGDKVRGMAHGIWDADKVR